MYRAIVALALALSGCSLESSAIRSDSGAEGDVGTDSMPADTDPVDSRRRDTTVPDAPLDAPDAVDAGPPTPTEVLMIEDAGGQGSHPAVIWNDGEFVVGLVTDGHVELLRMPPGRAIDVRERVTAVPGTDLQDVVLANGGGQMLVGWTEDRGGDASLVIRRLPDDPAPRVIASGIHREGDRRDAVVYATTGGFGAVYRTEALGTQTLSHVSTSGGGPAYLTSTLGSLGELDLHESPLGPLLVHGRPQAMFRHDGSSWALAAALVLGDGSEGAVAPLADGTIASVWLHADLLSTARVLSYARHRPGVVWTLDGSVRELSVEGSDPALAPFDGGVLMAFTYPDATGRTLGLVAIDSGGNFIAGPCRIPPAAPFANDPDVACAGEWCAVAWMEASEYAATDYVTRVIQVPNDRDSVCP